MTRAQAEEQQILSILEQYVSSVNARVMLQRSIREVAGNNAKLEAGDLRRVCDDLCRGLDLFVDGRHREEVRKKLQGLGGVQEARGGARSIAIKAEADISRARVEARELCEALRAGAFTVQKVTTIVSELARNIVNYTPGGTIELLPQNGARWTVVVCATDSGSGIGNIELVFSGRYKSKTGMGKGLLGCKRLADRFDVSSGARGTFVRAEVDL